MITDLTLVYALDPKTNELRLTFLPYGTSIPDVELRSAEKELSGSYARLSSPSHPVEFAFAGTFSYLPVGPYKVTRLTHGPGHREPTIRLEYHPPTPAPKPAQSTVSVWEQALSAGAAKLLALSGGSDPGLATGVRELAKLLEDDRELIVWICLIGYLAAAEQEAGYRAERLKTLLDSAIQARRVSTLDQPDSVPPRSVNTGRVLWKWLGFR